MQLISVPRVYMYDVNLYIWSIHFGRRRLIELHRNAGKIIVDPLSEECYISGVKLILCNEKCLFPDKAEQIFFCRWQWSKFLFAIAANFFRQKSIIFPRFGSVLCARFSECKIPKFVKFAAVHYSASNSDFFLRSSIPPESKKSPCLIACESQVARWK